YDRDRDCPVQAGVERGTRADRWRDCAVDRILYHEQRLGDPTLDRLDRGTSLKYLVHYVGALHQPFHALGPHGGNDINIALFGKSNCSNNPTGPPLPCNLHSVWDGQLLAHRGLNEQQTIAQLNQLIASRGWTTTNPGTPAEWAGQSFQLAKAALLPQNGAVD